MLKEATISERKIVNAFIELLEESSLEQISITDIIMKANLSRPTSYYYYSNKEDLVETTFSKILDKISSILQEDMTYQEGVVTEMLRYLKENQKLCLTLMTHIPNINEMIREFIIETILNSDIENVTELMEQSYHIPAKYSLEVYVSTIVTILTIWLKEGCIESPEENKLEPLRPSLFFVKCQNQNHQEWQSNHSSSLHGESYELCHLLGREFLQNEDVHYSCNPLRNHEHLCRG